MEKAGRFSFGDTSQCLALIAILSLIGTSSTSVLGNQTFVPMSTYKNSGEAFLLFAIGVHIEPLGIGSGRGLGYDDHELFVHHVEDLKLLAEIAEKHGGKLVIQAQTPFTRVVAHSDERLLADLEARGHEIGLHFHEDAHLGRNPESRPIGIWAETMAEEISLLKQAGATRIRYWSGGNLYSEILEAASLAGLEIMGDYKNPRRQETSVLVVGVNPWRPLSGPNGDDLTDFAQHDHNGRIIYLPDGSYDPEGFADKRQIIKEGGEGAYSRFLEESLKRSLADTRPDRVNVFHITIHPGEFRGDPSKPYEMLDRFLRINVDPLAAEGKIRWATFSQMADAYVQWEKNNPGVNPRTKDLGTVFGSRSGSAIPVRVDRDVMYGIVDGVALKMDLYYPKSTPGPVPIAVYVHGGGWTTGDKASGAGFREVQEMVNRGYLVAAIDYRLAPRYKFPAQIEDVKCAIRYMRANAQKYSADPMRIGAWGGSAGGHLVALLGLTDASAGFDSSGGYNDESSRVQAVVVMFGPADLTQLFAGAGPHLLETVFGTVDRNDEIIRRASPVNYVSVDDPPFLILHGESDELVPASQSQILYDRLRATGLSASLLLVKNAGHGFSPVGGPIAPSRQEITQMVGDFFDRYLKDPKTVDVQVVSQTTMLGDDSTQVILISRKLAQIGSGIGTIGVFIATVICASVIVVVCTSGERERSPDLKPFRLS